MSYQPFMKCPRCDGKHTQEVLSIVGLPVEVCSNCAMRLSEFVHDLGATVIGAPDEWKGTDTTQIDR